MKKVALLCQVHRLCYDSDEHNYNTKMNDIIVYGKSEEVTAS